VFVEIKADEGGPDGYAALRAEIMPDALGCMGADDDL